MQTELMLLDEKTIKDKMYYIRGQYVMIDSDLAKIYGYTTKAFNQQVQRNIEKFDNDFMFRLTKDEYYLILRSQNVTLKLEQGKYSKYLPYAFTEQGIYMLMTVLKGDLAIEQSKSLIRIFKNMKDYLINNNLLDQKYINNLVLNHNNDIKYLYDKLEEKELKNKLFFNGELFDSYLEIIKILNESKKEIIIIDNYADITLLEIIKDINKNIVLITNKKILKDIDIEKYNKQYHNLKVIYNNDFHDRFIVLDKNKIYHLGSSINHLGNKIFVINIIGEPLVKKSLLNEINKICKSNCKLKNINMLSP